jgi:hypothetical protein
MRKVFPPELIQQGTQMGEYCQLKNLDLGYTTTFFPSFSDLFDSEMANDSMIPRCLQAIVVDVASSNG